VPLARLSLSSPRSLQQTRVRVGEILTLQQGGQLVQGRIRCVLEPTFDEDSIIWLQRKVFCYVVHNDGLVKRSTYPGQILDEDHACRASMLPVEPVGDMLRLVDCVKHPVCIVLHGSGENDNFVHLCHFSEEFFTAGSDAETTFSVILVVVD